MTLGAMASCRVTRASLAGTDLRRESGCENEAVRRQATREATYTCCHASLACQVCE